jgi:hypothetical protein
MLPMDNYLSSSVHGAKTLTQHIGLKYNKIHACSYGCVLYRTKYANFIHWYPLRFYGISPKFHR